MASKIQTFTATLTIAVFMPGIAYAYIGPGLGAGAIASVLGVLVAIVVGLFAIIYYPVKRALRRSRQPDAIATKQEAPKSSADTKEQPR